VDVGDGGDFHLKARLSVPNSVAIAFAIVTQLH
jgi:hypothetical protein